MTSKETVKDASLADLKTWFNANKDRPRLVALMSPTCGFCLVGHQAVRTYHSWLPDADFATHRVWVPMMADDERPHADAQASTTDDGRIADSWDDVHEVARAYRDVLGLAAAAWDTYMLYEAGVEWTGDLPPPPTKVQYQLYPSWAPDQTRRFTPTDIWWNLVELVGQTQAEHDAPVPAFTAWLNDDPSARFGDPVPERYTRTLHEKEAA